MENESFPSGQMLIVMEDLSACNTLYDGDEIRSNLKFQSGNL